MPIFRITYNQATRLFTLKDKERNLKFKGESPNHVITDWLNHIEDLKGGYAPTYLTDQQILDKFKTLGFKMPLDVLDTTPLDVLEADLASSPDPDYPNAEWRVTQLFDISAQDLRDLYDSSN